MCSLLVRLRCQHRLWQFGKFAGAKRAVVLQDLHVRLELGDPTIAETINGIEFVPPSESTEFRTELKNSAPRRKARIVPPNHNNGR